jgi:hypothetical protein
MDLGKSFISFKIILLLNDLSFFEIILIRKSNGVVESKTLNAIIDF